MTIGHTSSFFNHSINSTRGSLPVSLASFFGLPSTCLRFLQHSKLKNFTPLPNEIFSLHLSTGELATYAVLMRLEDPRTYECWPSYETIGKAIGKSKSSVKRYVAGLVEKGLITVEPTSVIMRNGLKKNGNLRYHIRPIREAVEWYTQHQLYLAEAAAERQRVQRKLSAQAEEPPCSPR